MESSDIKTRKDAQATSDIKILLQIYLSKRLQSYSNVKTYKSDLSNQTLKP